MSLDAVKTRAALRTSARFSLQLLGVLALTGVALWLLGRVWADCAAVPAAGRGRSP